MHIGVKAHSFSKLSNKIGYILLKHPVLGNILKVCRTSLQGNVWEISQPIKFEEISSEIY